MPYKVIQYATGGVGTMLLRETIDNPDLELVGVRVFSDAKHGKDAGELADRPATGIRATSDMEEILALDADVVLHAPLGADRQSIDSDVIKLLESGKNVISTAGYVGPQARGGDVADRLEKAAQTGGATLHGSGIEPGFIFDRLATTLTSPCLHLEHLKMTEIGDVGKHPEPSMVVDALGMGRPLDSLSVDSPFGAFFAAFFSEVMHSVAHTLSLGLETIDVGLDSWPATRDFDIAAGHVARGTIGATRYWLSGIVEGREMLRIEIDWFAEPRLGGMAVPEHHAAWIIEIEGKPSIRNRFDLLPSLSGSGDYEPMYYSTMSTVIRTIPAVVAAPPGLLTAQVFAPFAPTLTPR